MTDYIIIFGAAVRPDGSPSPALHQRIDAAIDWARGHPAAMFVPTGAVGRHGPAEASVITAALVAAGIARDRIIPETHARDTLESVRLCDALLRARGDVDSVICLTSSYHQTRCALLLRLLGYNVVTPLVRTRLHRVSAMTYATLVLKEVAATPYDAILLLFHRFVSRQSVAPT